MPFPLCEILSGGILMSLNRQSMLNKYARHLCASVAGKHVLSHLFSVLNSFSFICDLQVTQLPVIVWSYNNYFLYQQAWGQNEICCHTCNRFLFSILSDTTINFFPTDLVQSIKTEICYMDKITGPRSPKSLNSGVFNNSVCEIFSLLDIPPLTAKCNTLQSGPN